MTRRDPPAASRVRRRGLPGGGALGLTVLCVLADPACGQTLTDADLADLPPGVTPAMVRRGQEVFQGEGLCSGCHGVEGGGLLGPDLTDADWWHARGSYLELVTRIRRGVPADESVTGVTMPPAGGVALSDVEIQAVAAYVWRVSHPEVPDSLPAGVSREMVALGYDVFHRPGSCVRCHGTGATGDTGPDLTDQEWLHAKGSFFAIVQTIVAGVPIERSRSGAIMPPRGGSAINDADVYSVAAYVWVRSRPRPGG